ncbi:senescence-associated protein-domain-containing protein [Irpex rosettiformis]|uniref:Senescence-associated protein-domain-containing protein n=1 Tax=Irpex rosettiformis TaxID=378272 RepID=A0ACB8UHG9_9APHY|nr:senescence-associated protein-domain-containing protein [Irpex rosettiformis]
MSFPLLTLPNVLLTTPQTTEHGTLWVEWSPQPDNTTVLVLHLNSCASGIVSGSSVTLVIAPSGEREYAFEKAFALNEKGSQRVYKAGVRVIVSPPDESARHVVEDIQTFDQVLTQYAELSWSHAIPAPSSLAPPPLPVRSPQPQTSRDAPQVNIKQNVEDHKPVQDESLHGRLVLMDDSSGEILGELPQTLNIKEDSAFPSQRRGADNAAPVVLELQPEMYDAVTGVRPLGAEGEELRQLRDVMVRVVPPEERDWILKSATLISQAISSSTSVLVSGITSASNYYITHSQPGKRSGSGTPNGSGSNTPLSSSSSTTNAALSKVHIFSGQARTVSSKAVDAVGGVIRRAMGAKPDTPPIPLYSPTAPLYESGPPPPYAVYTPKPRRPPPPPPSVEKEEEPSEPKPLKTLDKVLISANLVLTTIDDSARRMFEVSNDRLGAVVGHKYGMDAQQTTNLTMNTAKNVVLVYVDMRGFARRALLQKTGVEFVKSRVQKSKAKEQKEGGSGTSTPVSEKS